jgi:adenylylsulfate kinase-like enzyme
MSDPANRPLPIVKVVGVSAGGKSTLVQALRAAGYDARAVSQEHSHVRDLWKQFEIPRVLIYLDNELEVQRARRPDVVWEQATLDEERARLQDAYAEADLRINTAHIDRDQVCEMVLAYLEALGIRRADKPLPPAPPTGSAGSAGKK